jgi:NADH dehydrogenase
VLAWWLWLLVHVLALVDFRRRFAVVVEWAWAYFSWQRRSRVILEVPVEPRDARISSYAAGRGSTAFRRSDTAPKKVLHTTR